MKQIRSLIGYLFRSSRQEKMSLVWGRFEFTNGELRIDGAGRKLKKNEYVRFYGMVEDKTVDYLKKHLERRAEA